MSPAGFAPLPARYHNSFGWPGPNSPPTIEISDAVRLVLSAAKSNATVPLPGPVDGCVVPCIKSRPVRQLHVLRPQRRVLVHRKRSRTVVVRIEHPSRLHPYVADAVVPRTRIRHPAAEAPRIHHLWKSAAGIPRRRPIAAARRQIRRATSRSVHVTSGSPFRSAFSAPFQNTYAPAGVLPPGKRDRHVARLRELIQPHPCRCHAVVRLHATPHIQKSLQGRVPTRPSDPQRLPLAHSAHRPVWLLPPAA